MDSLLINLATAGVFFLTLSALCGGSVAYWLDKKFANTHRDYVHTPSWDKNGAVTPRHQHCKTCEIEVVQSGGVLVSASSME